MEAVLSAIVFMLVVLSAEQRIKDNELRRSSQNTTIVALAIIEESRKCL